MTKIRSFLILFLFSLFSVQNASASSYDSITYNLSTKNIQNYILNVEIILKGKFQDQLILDLPSKWAGVEYNEQIKNIQVADGHKLELIHRNNNEQAVITISDNQNTELKITYEIHQKAGNPSDIHEAIVRHDLIHAPGYGVFATPTDLNGDDKINISINWFDLDPKWLTLSSYGTKNNFRKQLSAPELLHAVYAVGNIRLHQISIEKSPVYLSLYGKFDLEDEQIISDIEGIIDSQRKFFDDYNFPYYAISLIEGDRPNSMGGTRLYNSFTAFLPKEMDRSDYYILFAHEHLHNWIGGRIQNNKDEELNYWWSEGFTDYYARLIAYRSGAIDRTTFIKEINNFLLSYYLSPVAQQPNARIKKDFWNNYDIEKLPYYRGFVFAIYLNDLIKKENFTKSLDDVMHDLLKETPKKFSVGLFKKIVGKYVKNGIDKEISSFIDAGNIISLEYVSLPIQKNLVKGYYLGFDKDAFQSEKRITNVDIRSNAYKSGIRNNQEVLGYDITKGYRNSNQTITIKTTGGEHKFVPEHYKKKQVFQIKQIMSQEEQKSFDRFFD
ncbi:MAG TPA: M1 family aminopeptidase [Candidatus Megaira endosymbiont of Nemacystus decipiens]|nr:M1 family aminopeptidase [Candidatus Megaera endosymbiont of Nemacystus decipiens]